MPVFAPLKVALAAARASQFSHPTVTRNIGAQNLNLSGLFSRPCPLDYKPHYRTTLSAQWNNYTYLLIPYSSIIAACK
jgi:hypothetical protein